MVEGSCAYCIYSHRKLVEVICINQFIATIVNPNTAIPKLVDELRLANSQLVEHKVPKLTKDIDEFYTYIVGTVMSISFNCCC